MFQAQSFEQFFSGLALLSTQPARCLAQGRLQSSRFLRLESVLASQCQRCGTECNTPIQGAPLHMKF